MIGAGKYDNLCTEIRERLCARAVVLIVKDGDKGSGFSMQAPIVETAFLPQVLRQLADQIEADFKRGKF